MKISLTIDDEVPVDLEYLIGRIRIEGYESLITVDNTYLDSWLQALIQGLRSLQARRQAEISLPEEPTSLFFELDNGNVRIRFGRASVSSSSVAEFATALKAAVEDFLQAIDALAPNQNNQIVESFREFARGAS